MAAGTDARTKSEPLPDQIEIAEQPRPWGDTFFPKSRPSAKELLVVQTEGLDKWEFAALQCLQALTSRRQPRLWLLHESDPWGMKGLELHKRKGYIKSYHLIKEWRSLFKRFSSAYRGAVIPDESLYQGPILAADIAAVEDLIIASPKLAEELGLNVQRDLRGRFGTLAEGMKWLWENYSGRFNHHLCTYAWDYYVANTQGRNGLAYDIQWRSFIFYISGDGETGHNLRGCDPRAELQVIAEILSQLPPNIPVRGFPLGPNGGGLGEANGVDFLGSYGKVLVASTNENNVCVTSAITVDRLTAPPQPPTPSLENERVYIALTVSDGDNQGVWYQHFQKEWLDPAHGRVPVGWGIAPSLIDVLPAMTEWYYEEARAGDEFLADLSGIGYIHFYSFGSRYRERQKVLEGFVDWTSRYMKRLGIRALRTQYAGPEDEKRFARSMPFLQCLVPDYGHRGGTTGDNAWEMINGLPVFRALTGWSYKQGPVQGLFADIKQDIGNRRPAFVNAFLLKWEYGVKEIEEIYKAREPDMVFVTPTQLARLYRAYRGEARRT